MLEHDGRIVSACRVQVHRLRVGCCEISKGDVGTWARLPEVQGRGFASELMRDTVGYLKEAGCQIGRLAGHRVLLAVRVVPFPRRYYEFRLELAHAGVRTLQPDQYLLPPEGFRGGSCPSIPCAITRGTCGCTRRQPEPDGGARGSLRRAAEGGGGEAGRHGSAAGV